jgi:hypothetical protein
LLRKRLRQLLRVTLILSICLTVAATALTIWWLNSLNGLPDIGDPFDVEAFRTFSLPEDKNAFTYFLRAGKQLTPIPISVAISDPRLRAWREANRSSVSLVIEGAEQTDGISGPPGEPPAGEEDLHSYPMEGAGVGWGLLELTIAEGERRAESGDMAGAWDCHRAVLRMSAHVRRRERLKDRLRLSLRLPVLKQGLATWAADPRTTIPQLRRALEEVVECRPRPEWDAFTLKREYLDLMRFLDGPVNPPAEQIEEELTYRLGDVQLPTGPALQLHGVKRRLAREPERSRRVIRLIFANWLAQVQNSDLRRRKPFVRVRFHVARRTTSVLLYPVGPEAPEGARVLSPQEVASWLPTTNDARLAYRYDFLAWPSLHRSEQRGYRELLVLLAGEIYRRERGTMPPSDEALVGTYLESLPDDGSADLADEATPTVE